MVFTLVRAYTPGTGNCIMDKLYLFNDHVKALERFYKEYPKYKELICMASGIDAADPKNAEFIAAHIKAYY